MRILNTFVSMSLTVLLKRLSHSNRDETSMLLWAFLWWWQPVRNNSTWLGLLCCF